MKRIVDGHGTERDLDQLLEIGQTICPGDFPHAASERLGLEAMPFPFKMTTICFVGPSAYTPVALGAHAVPRRVRSQARAAQPDPGIGRSRR